MPYVHNTCPITRLYTTTYIQGKLDSIINCVMYVWLARCITFKPVRLKNKLIRTEIGQANVSNLLRILNLIWIWVGLHKNILDVFEQTKRCLQ